MRLDEGLGDGQAEAGPAPAAVLAEHLEDPLSLVGARCPDPRRLTAISTRVAAGPAHRPGADADGAVLGARAAPRSPAGWPGPGSISTWSISQQRQVGGASTTTRPGGTRPPSDAERLVDQLVEGDGGGPQLERPRLDAGHVEQVGDQPGQAVGLQLNELQQLGPVLGARAGRRPGAGWTRPS